MSPWIVDLGASDHMTGDVAIFRKYNPCYENFSVWIVDGSLSKVAGTSSVMISKDLTLNFVLLVTNLDCNLLSISKLTRELNYITKFFPNYYEFQERWSSCILENFFLHYSIINALKCFWCEICQFSKHVCNSYPNQSYKSPLFIVMFGDPLGLIMLQVLDGLYHLWMITSKLLGYSSWRKNPK